jgi:hypothetical protein
MIRKLGLLLSVLALLTIVAAVSADPATDGCYVDAPASVNEGVQFTVTNRCENVTPDTVFGFQIGNAVTGDYLGSLPTTYTFGQFSSTATEFLLQGSNTLALYGVSRTADDFVSAEDFTLGSYNLTANVNLTDDDGAINVDFLTGVFKLSDDQGSAISGWLRTVNDAQINVNDIDLAWLTGDVVVHSDVTTLSEVTDVDLNIGGYVYSADDQAGSSATLSVTAGNRYQENADLALAADSDDELLVNVTADMYGHAECSTNNVNLLDAGMAEDVDGFVGTAGDITLLAGDANNDGDITNSDATIIGNNFGFTGGSIGSGANVEPDINRDNTVDILDLVHAGRNFEVTPAFKFCD